MTREELIDSVQSEIELAEYFEEDYRVVEVSLLKEILLLIREGDNSNGAA